MHGAWKLCRHSRILVSSSPRSSRHTTHLSASAFVGWAAASAPSPFSFRRWWGGRRGAPPWLPPCSPPLRARAGAPLLRPPSCPAFALRRPALRLWTRLWPWPCVPSSLPGPRPEGPRPGRPAFPLPPWLWGGRVGPPSRAALWRGPASPRGSSRPRSLLPPRLSWTAPPPLVPWRGSLEAPRRAPPPVLPSAARPCLLRYVRFRCSRYRRCLRPRCYRCHRCPGLWRA